VESTPHVVKRYQADRLKEKAAPKTINDEVQLLLRLCGEQGALIRATLHRDKALKLALPPSPGRPYSTDEKSRMMEEALKLRTPQMRAALALALNTGLRDKELRQIRWEQIDLIDKKALMVGKSKTAAGTGRIIPLNETALAALVEHAAWYTRRFGECRPEWYVFAFGTPLPKDPPNHVVQNGLDQSPQEGWGEGPMARQPPHAGYRTGGVGCRRRGDYGHRRPRLARHAFALLPCSDGSQAARTRRNRHTPAHGGRKTPTGHRTAAAGCGGLRISVGSVINWLIK